MIKAIKMQKISQVINAIINKKASYVINNEVRSEELREWMKADNHNNTGDNKLAIVDVPLAVVEDINWRDIKNPQDVLHSILIHNI